MGKIGSGPRCVSRAGKAVREIRIQGGAGPNLPWNRSNEIAAGGPIRNPTVHRIKVTPKAISLIENQLKLQFGSRRSPSNTIMINRLYQISSDKLSASLIDLLYYFHELREIVRYRRLGYGFSRIPSKLSQDVWLQVHTATLLDYDLPTKFGESILYQYIAKARKLIFN